MASKGLQSLFKDYGDYLQFADKDISPHYFPFGVLALNRIVADNNGRGIPGGSIIQLLAENKRGKSTLALDLLSNTQKSKLHDVEIPDGKKTRKINALVIDFEHSYDKEYAEKIGVDNSKVLLIQHLYAEDAFNIAEGLLVEGLQFILIDSVAMAVPRSEEDKNLNDSAKIASEAWAIGRFLKRANVMLDETQIIVLVNQYRANMSQMSRSDKKPYGARIIQYVSKLTIELERIENKATRTTVQALVSKTKFGAEGRKITFDIEFGKGIDYKQHLLDLAKEFMIVDQSGSYYTFDNVKVQGEEKAKQAFDFDKISAAVIAYMEKGT